MAEERIATGVLLPGGARGPRVPAGYKWTEAGTIPQDWRTSRVGTEFVIQLGKMLDAAKNVGTPKPYIGNRSVQWGRIDLNDIATVPMTSSDLHRFRLKTGDLLVCEGGEIGRAAVWSDAISECYYQKALHRLRPTRGYDVYLMMFLLQLWASTGYLANYVTQTSIAHLPKDKLELILLPVPSAKEQRAIAEALSDVDGLLDALDALITKKLAIKRAAMQQLLTGKIRLPGFNRIWKIRKIREMLTYEHPDHYIVQHQEYTARGDFPVLTANKSFVLGYTNETFGVCTDLPVILFDDFTTDCKYVTFPFKVKSSAIKLLRARKRVDLSWMFGRIQMVDFPLTDHKRYYISYYQNIDLAFPSYNEQLSIASVISDMDAEIAILQRRRDKTRTLKQGMMQQLLTGRTRLPVPE